MFIKKWKEIVSYDRCILRIINKHGPIGNSLNSASISTILKSLQEELKFRLNQQLLNGQSFRVDAALNLLEQGDH